MAWLFFAAYNLLSGGRDGILAWILREDVPPRRSEWVDAAMHKLGLVIYALVIAAVGYAVGYDWGLLVQAALARLVVFDVSLIAARRWYDHREGRTMGAWFQVGTTAKSDRATRWLASRLRLSPERLRLAGWLFTLAAGVAWLLW